MTCEAAFTTVESPIGELSFLVENCSWLWLGQAVPLVHCRFDMACYRDSLFDELQIPLPECIRQSVSRRRAEFLAGRYCALRALDNLCLQPVTLGRDKNGLPVWPRGVTGSISHCRGQAVALVMQQDSSSRLRKLRLPAVGIDIEELIHPATAANIESRILNPAERTLLAATAAPRDLLLTLAFSAKESFFKAVYPVVGRYFDFDAVSVTHFDRRLNCLRLRVNQALHASLPPGREVEVSCQLLTAQQVMTRVVIT